MWVDRLQHRPVLLASDLGQAVIFGSVPVAAAFDVLTLGHLYAVALLLGVCRVFFNVAYQAYLPFLVPRADLVERNATLEGSRSAAQVAGPGLDGILVQVLGAPFALVADAVRLLVSAGCLCAIGVGEPARPGRARRGLRRGISEGARFVLGSRLLVTLLVEVALANLFLLAYGRCRWCSSSAPSACHQAWSAA